MPPPAAQSSSGRDDFADREVGYTERECASGSMSMADARKRIRLLIADDVRLFRDALSVLLETEPSFEVVGYAANGDETIPLATRLKPDVLLLDLVMPHMGGIETLRALSAAQVPVRTILLTAAIERPDVLIALQLGARGVLLKDASPELLFKSIRVVMAGQYWVDATAVSDVISAFRAAAPAADAAAPPKFGLTRRELEIVIAVAAGESNREISRRLNISQETVKHHLTNIYNKVGASTRVELALFAVHNNLT
jgi:two-component system nitrate/nitrite response regulator NarL